MIAMAVFLLATCGNADKVPPDLTVTVEADLAMLVDSAMPSSDMIGVLPDFAFSPCATPKPGIYNETVQYNYAPAAGGPAMFASWGSTAVVRNDGSFSRPSNVFVSPDRYHCGFTTFDMLTCIAVCCPGQAGSPTMYFDAGGWTTWTGGACAFQTTTGAQFIANILTVDGYFTR